MLKRLLRAARLSSALRTTLQSAEVSGIRQITSVGQPFDDVNIFMMLNRYAPCDSSSHKGSMEHVTSTSSSIPALMGHHSLLPATAAAIAELSKAGPVQLPSITESAYEDAVDGRNGLLDNLKTKWSTSFYIFTLTVSSLLQIS